ncbi:MAG: type II secretion system protein GspK [Planctomycetota bacterium]
MLKSTTTRAARTPARTSRSRRRTSRRTASRTVRSTTTQKRPAVAHTTDFAKLFHSSLLDQELLARPLPDTGERIESPLKYLSLWGSQRVNINTAPRHVLEAAFSLAMDSFDLPEFVQEVITQRKEKPFQKIDELKELGGLDADTMKNLNNYLTTTSTFFQVRITSRSGGASSSAVATVVKEGRNTQQLVILYEQ